MGSDCLVFCATSNLRLHSPLKPTTSYETSERESESCHRSTSKTKIMHGVIDPVVLRPTSPCAWRLLLEAYCCCTRSNKDETIDPHSNVVEKQIGYNLHGETTDIDHAGRTAWGLERARRWLQQQPASRVSMLLKGSLSLSASLLNGDT